MRKALIALAVGASLALTGCSSGTVEGTVTDKTVDRGSCKTKSGKTKCSSDEYELVVRRTDGVTEEIDVSKRDFDAAVIGQYGSYRR